MCGFPVNIRNPKYTDISTVYMQVPCGKCADCLKERANQWYIRLHYENKVATSAYFVTLTYEVPKRTFNGLLTVDKRDLQLYLKRLRKLDRTTGIKYYACSEYGEKFHRPHYHLIIFNVQDRNNLIRAWEINQEIGNDGSPIMDKVPIGKVDIGTVEPGSMRYVTGYIEKRIGIPQSDYDDRMPEFSLMSKNMGLYFIDHVASFNTLNQVGYTVLNGKKYNLSRYYKNKIFKDYEKAIIGEQNRLRYLQIQDQRVKNFPSLEACEKNQREVIIGANRGKPIISSNPLAQ